MTNYQNSNTDENAGAIKRRLVRWLLEGGLGFRPSMDAIGNEVLFSSNWRRADLLILSEEFHAIEIKSPADGLSLLADQLADYHRVFDKVSIVTAPAHVKSVRRIALKRTGIICCAGEAPSVIRQATRTSRLNRLELCKFLGKRELASLLGGGAANMSTDELRSKLASCSTVKDIRQAAYESVRRRYSKLFRSFLQDVDDSKFAEDELRGLCGTVDAIRM